MRNRFVQFELWRDCNVGCRFCFNRGLQKSDKISNIRRVLDILKGESLDGYNEIGLIGGEFFGGQLEDERVERGFYEIIDGISHLLQNGFDKFYITTSLIYEDDVYLREFLETLRKLNMINKTVLCTSYDTIYRFSQDWMLESWSRNMDMMRMEYPDLKTHVEMIVTQDFIDKSMDGRFDIVKFVERYDASVDFIEPNTGNSYKTKADFDKDVPGFLPTRDSFMDFVRKMCMDRGVINVDFFLNRNIRSDAVYLFYGDDTILIKDRKEVFDRMQDLGNIIDRKFGYLDSDMDMETDIRILRCE